MKDNTEQILSKLLSDPSSLINAAAKLISTDEGKTILKSFYNMINEKEPEDKPEAAPEQKHQKDHTPNEEADILASNTLVDNFDFLFTENFSTMEDAANVKKAFDAEINKCQQFIENNKEFLKGLYPNIKEDLNNTLDELINLNNIKINNYKKIFEYIETYKNIISIYNTIATHSKNYYENYKKIMKNLE